VQHRVEMMAMVLIGLSVSTHLRAEDVLPAPGLLEYLGNLVEDDGNYVDPLDMEDFQALSRDQIDNTSDETMARTAKQSDAQPQMSPTASGDRP
jgi:hypothetical protein